VDTVLVGDSADAQIGLPPGDEALAAVPAIVRGQQLALATARRRGIDPDAPFGLSKITAT
jgi:glucosamine--fructose-6-phosphate aminotransferase (isomerizing)